MLGAHGFNLQQYVATANCGWGRFLYSWEVKPCKEGHDNETVVESTAGARCGASAYCGVEILIMIVGPESPRRKNR